MGVAEEGGIIPDHLSKFLPRVVTVGATFWVGNLGIDGNDAAKTRWGTREFHAAGDGDEGSKAGGGDLAKGRGG